MDRTEPRAPGPADVIADTSVRALYLRLVQTLRALHDDMDFHESEVDFRAEFAGCLVCRLVPYRELIHVHVGENPAWEVRIRRNQDYVETLDRVVSRFLRLVAQPGRD